jgi:hypothetical protein
MVKNEKPGMKALDWLLETSDPGVRYPALRDLVKAEGKELEAAKKAAHTEGPIAEVLKNMNPEGWWETPGSGYSPKYTSSVWALMLLAQLGGNIKADKRINTAANYMIEQALTKNGSFSVNGSLSGTVDCLQGNLCYTLVDLGYTGPLLDKAFDWTARSVTGEGIAPMTEKTAQIRYYSSKCGPVFACGANDKQSCAWGAASVMLAFSKLPKEKRTPLIERAIKTGVDFLFSVDPSTALWPSAYTGKPSGNWWKFGFPVFYIKDILEITEGLVRLGYGKDKRLVNTLQLIKDKQDARGRWLMEYDYSGKTWADFGPKKQPNKWVTLRALRVLGMVEESGNEMLHPLQRLQHDRAERD